MAQVSRAAPPGARRIEASVAGAAATGVELLAFALPGGGTSLVVFNTTDADHPLQVEDGGRFLDIPAPGRSILTFVW
jgi:hypothetical protein